MQALLLYCRPGFEAEAAAEIQHHAAALGATGFCRAKAGAGHLVFECHQADQSRELAGRIRFARLVFARQLVLTSGALHGLVPADRAGPLASALAGLADRLDGVFVEHADSEPGKQLAGLCRALARPLELALAEAGVSVGGPAAWRGHVLVEGSTYAWPGVSLVGNSAPWPMGILRLKMPRAAPSRSALKLDEAVRVLLEDHERADWLREGMRAVDLGAAPGGWTWQLVRRGLFVQAVDNARLDGRLLADGMVDHLRQDGFGFRPPAPVDWMVCDMVEQPSRVADLVAGWLGEGFCRFCIFNLKLPMKKRWAEILACRERIERALAARGLGCDLRLKQLYHDREEVTGFARSLAGVGR